MLRTSRRVKFRIQATPIVKVARPWKHGQCSAWQEWRLCRKQKGLLEGWGNLSEGKGAGTIIRTCSHNAQTDKEPHKASQGRFRWGTQGAKLLVEKCYLLWMNVRLPFLYHWLSRSSLLKSLPYPIRYWYPPRLGYLLTSFPQSRSVTHAGL